MTRSGKTPATKTYCGYIEVAAELLRQYVGGNFRSTEQAVLGMVDAHRLVDAIAVFMLIIDLPAFLLLDQRQTVRSVAVDFVRGSEDEGRMRKVIPRQFEHVQGAIRIDGEIRVHVPGGPVVGRLGSGVYYRFYLMANWLDDSFKCGGVSDVNMVMRVSTAEIIGELLQVPAARSIRAEKFSPHVVINADYGVAFCGEKPGRFRADQPGTS